MYRRIQQLEQSLEARNEKFQQTIKELEQRTFDLQKNMGSGDGTTEAKISSI
jgi:hypothetical protein